MNFSKHQQASAFRSGRRLIALLLLLVVFLPTFSAFASEEATVTAKVILRKAADKDSKALQTLPEGETIAVLGTSGDWYKVGYGKFSGYVMKKYVKLGKNSVVANSSKIAKLGDAPGPMKVGDNGDDVKKLQQALDILNYYNGRIDGDYGAGTTAAVLAYQVDKGLTSDGVAGKSTVKSIFGSVGTAQSSSGSSSPSSSSASSGTSSSASNSGTVSKENTVSSIEEIGSTPAASKEGDSGTKVKKLQQALELLGYYSGIIDGKYGEETIAAVKRLQKNRGMKQDGIAGASTIRVLFGSSASSSSSASTSSSSTSKAEAKTEVLDWFADNVTSTIPKNAKFTIKDVRTGKTFTAVRWSGSSHLDAEPASAEDTKTLKSIYGGSWSWDRRPILILYKNHVYAASMNGMPHGTTVVSGNDFDGHFCVHFKNSKTHGTDRVDPDHQTAVSAASKASW